LAVAVAAHTIQMPAAMADQARLDRMYQQAVATEPTDIINTTAVCQVLVLAVT
jgi:hypothetical protein